MDCYLLSPWKGPKDEQEGTQRTGYPPLSRRLCVFLMIRDTGKQNLCTGQSKALNPSGSHFWPLLLTTTTVYNIKMLKISLSLPAHQMNESM